VLFVNLSELLSNLISYSKTSAALIVIKSHFIDCSWKVEKWNWLEVVFIQWLVWCCLFWRLVLFFSLRQIVFHYSWKKTEHLWRWPIDKRINKPFLFWKSTLEIMCRMGFVTGGPNEAIVVSGCFHSQPLIVVGGWAFVIPCIQKVQRLPLNIMTLKVASPKVYTMQGVPLSVTGIAQVRNRWFFCKS